MEHQHGNDNTTTLPMRLLYLRAAVTQMAPTYADSQGHLRLRRSGGTCIFAVMGNRQLDRHAGGTPSTVRTSKI